MAQTKAVIAHRVAIARPDAGHVLPTQSGRTWCGRGLGLMGNEQFGLEHRDDYGDRLNWPTSNLELDRIRFDSSSIWNGSDDAPPSDISTGWTGNRNIGGDSPTKAVVFEFTATAQPSGYDLQVHFDLGCQITAGG